MTCLLSYRLAVTEMCAKGNNFVTGALLMTALVLSYKEAWDDSFMDLLEHRHFYTVTLRRFDCLFIPRVGVSYHTHARVRCEDSF